jgi:hypothetical protein
MTLDDAIRELERACKEAGFTQAQIDEEVANLRRLNGLAEDAEARGLHDIAAAYRQVLRGTLDALMRRCPALAKIVSLIFTRTGLAAEVGKALGKVIKLGTSTAGLVFVEVLFYAPENPGSVWGEFDLVDSVLMEHSTGDEIHCVIACIYRGPTRVCIGESTYPASSAYPQEEMVSIHEYDCGRPPSPAVLKQFCRKSFWTVLAN